MCFAFGPFVCLGSVCGSPEIPAFSVVALFLAAAGVLLVYAYIKCGYCNVGNIRALFRIVNACFISLLYRLWLFSHAAHQFLPTSPPPTLKKV